VIRVHALVNGSLRTEEGPEAVPDAPSSTDRLWVEAVAPGPEEEVALCLGLGLHELAFEDAMNEGHPPKLEDFGKHIFLITHTPNPGEQTGTRKVSIFLSKTWIVTIEREHVLGMEAIADRVRRDPARFLAAPEHLAHAVLDELTEGFECESDRLADRAEALEIEVLEDPNPSVLATVLDLRREVTSLARVVRDQRDVMQALVRLDERFSRDVVPYLRDVHDHLSRVGAQMDAVMHGLAAVREAYQSQVNNRLSDVMKILTVITTLMMPLHLIVGFWGMNFRGMPGLDSAAAFWGTVGLMGLTAGVMVYWFRRRGWI
jgi:magnesium transporter